MVRWISALILLSVAIAGLTYAGSIIGPRITGSMLPARTLRIVIEPDTRTVFFNHIRAFAKSHNFELTDTGDPHFPTGPILSFDLDRTDIGIFVTNLTKDIDPYQPNGPVSPPMDPSTYDIAFYNKSDKSGRSLGSVKEMVDAFKSAMSDIRGIQIQTEK